MRELQVPTKRIPVEVHTDDGSMHRGTLFGVDSPYNEGWAKTLMFVLGDERWFLPFEATDEKPFLLNKRHIVRVDVDPRQDWLDVDDAEDDEAPDTTLLLSDGKTIAGRLEVDTPRTESRAVDKLNLAGPFVRVRDRSAVHFVHVRHIVRAD